MIGGHSSELAVFMLDTWKYSETINLSNHIQSVKQMEFITQPFDGGANKILTILSGNGIVYFYDMKMCKIISKLSTNVEIIKFEVAFNGKELACILSSGELLLYNIAQYISIADNTYAKQHMKIKNCMSYSQAKQNQKLSSVQKQVKR